MPSPWSADSSTATSSAAIARPPIPSGNRRRGGTTPQPARLAEQGRELEELEDQQATRPGRKELSLGGKGRDRPGLEGKISGWAGLGRGGLAGKGREGLIEWSGQEVE